MISTDDDDGDYEQIMVEVSVSSYLISFMCTPAFPIKEPITYGKKFQFLVILQRFTFTIKLTIGILSSDISS